MRSLQWVIPDYFLSWSTRVLPIFLLVLCAPIGTQAQQLNLDSLEQVWLDENESDSLRLDAYYNLIWYKFMFNNPDTAYTLAGELATQAMEKGWPFWEGKASGLKGVTFGIRGDIQQAIQYFEKSIAILETCEGVNPMELANQYNNLGICYQRLSIYDTAIEYLQKSLTISQAENSEQTIIANRKNISDCYEKIGDYELARSYIEPLIDLATDLNTLGGAHESLGNIYTKTGDYTKAEEQYKLGIQTYEEIQFKVGKARILLGLGKLQTKLGDSDDALKTLLEAASMFQELQAQKELSNSFAEIGILHHKIGKYHEGLEWCDKAKQVAESIDLIDADRMACYCLYLNHKQLGNYDKALKNHEAYLQYTDSIINEEKIGEIATLETEYNFNLEKKKLEAEQKEALLNVKLEKSEARFGYLMTISALSLIILLGGLFFLQFNRKKAKEHTQHLTDKNIELTSKNQELQRFAYITSHDLKGPIQNISTFTALALKNKDAPEMDKYLGFIQQSSKRMQYLVESIMTFTKLTKKDTQFTRVDANQILEEVRETLQPKIEQRQAKIKVSALPTVIAAPPLLSLVFQNLIDNSIKFNQQEEPVVDIECSTTTTEYRFSVKDNGVGIEPEFQQKIFEPFSRLVGKEEGAGLGLSIVRDIVELHDGQIWVESEQAQGSIFYFTISKSIQPSQEGQ